MNHRMLRFPSGWEWHALHRQRPDTPVLSRRRKHAAGGGSYHDASAPAYGHETADAGAYGLERGSLSVQAPPSAGLHDESAIHELKRAYPELAKWIRETDGRTHNQVCVSELPGGEPVLSGTLMFQGSDDPEDIVPLHYWMTAGRLATIHTDLRLSVRLQLDPWEEKLQRCETAPEAFFVIVGSILETVHSGLDVFENRLGELEQTMRRGNRSGLMNVIFERRYDLLHWNHLFVPIREIHGAAKEAFMSALTEREEFKRAEYKLARIEELLEHYAVQIDTLLAMDEAIVSLRGNDIMKTLTIFTALFTPATVLGSIWGMNFSRIPWAKEPWGFAVIALLIVVMTVAIYWWLWRKGWTGDILHARTPREIVTPTETHEPPASRSEASRYDVSTRDLLSQNGFYRSGAPGLKAAEEEPPVPLRSRKARM